MRYVSAASGASTVWTRRGSDSDSGRACSRARSSTCSGPSPNTAAAADRADKPDGLFLLSNPIHVPVLQKGLKVMDATAISLCKDNDLPIIVFNLFKRGNIQKAVCGQKVGTKVY